MKTFSITEALGYGWEKMKEEFSSVFQISLIMWGIVLLSEGLFTFIDTNVSNPVPHITLLIVLGLISIIVNIVMQIGFYKVFVKLYNDEETSLSDLYSHYRLGWKFMAASILQGIIIFVGLLLFIIPGFIFATIFCLTKFIIADKEISPIAALKQSALLTRGVKFQLFKLGLILGLLNIVGVLLIVGFFITVPVSMFTMVYVYKKLALQTAKA